MTTLEWVARERQPEKVRKRKRDSKWREGERRVWTGLWPIFFGFGMTMSKLNVSSVQCCPLLLLLLWLSCCVIITIANG